MRRREWRRSRNLVLLVVWVALFLDAILMTVILPIVPDYLAKINVDSEINDDDDSSETNNKNETYDQSTKVGLLFASKAFIQVFVGPLVGAATNRIGYAKPMFAGFFLMFASTLMYAFASSYFTMLTARALQGVGSSFSSISGLAMLAQWYSDDRERGNAMSVAFSGTGFGVIVGPVFGGFFYQYFGKEVPFLILAGFALFDGGLRLLILDPKTPSSEEKIKAVPLLTLFKDPYILLTAGTIFLANMGIAILEPLLPIHMMQTMHASSFEQGIAFLPLSATFMIGLNLFGRLSYSIGRYRAAIMGFVLMGCCLIVIPFAKNMVQLILPNAGYGLAISLIESAMLPYMAYLVDVRHSAVYGNVYAITDTAFCLSFFVGPSVGGILMTYLGFQWTLWIAAIACFSYAPLLIFLRDPARKEEEQTLIRKTSASASVL